MKKGSSAIMGILLIFAGIILGVLIGRNHTSNDILISYQVGYVDKAIDVSPRPEIAPTAEIDEDFGKVNINTASLAQLQSLPNIGETLAIRIITYREENGPFTRIEDITLVDGIGQTRFERMKDDITVGG